MCPVVRSADMAGDYEKKNACIKCSKHLFWYIYYRQRAESSIQLKVENV